MGDSRDSENNSFEMKYKYPTNKYQNNDKKPSKTYEGVEYIPSDGAKRIPLAKRTNPGQPVRKPQAKRSGAGAGRASTPGSVRTSQKRKGSSQSGVFLAITVAVGALICVGAFFLMFNFTRPLVGGSSTESSKTSLASEPTGNDTGGVLGQDESDAEITGVIKTITSTTVTLIDSDSDSERELFLNSATSYKDKYGGVMTRGEFNTGDIVIASYNSINKKAQDMRIAPEAWQKTSIKNVEINTGTTTVKLGNDTYTLSKSVVFLPSGTDKNVKAPDVVTLKGYKSKILTVLVEKRTGTLEFINKDKIKDGTVEVDSDIYKALEETGSLKVLEGEHTVIIKGSNIDVFIKDITIRQGESVIVDLAEATPKTGIVILTVNEPEYSVYINDEFKEKTEEPLVLPYGAYKVKVTKEGFISWEGNVTIGQPTVAVTATLTQEVKMGRITVTTVPEGIAANVYIDNALMGIAPVRALVTYGEHQLTVKAEGYNDTPTPIVVEGDRSYQIILIKSVTNTEVNNNTDNTSNTSNTSDTVNGAGIGY